MQTPTHRLLGAASALALSPQLPWQGVLLAAVIASRTAGGITSPDVDQRWQHLGAGGPLGHRKITHWWGLPALCALGWVFWGPATSWFVSALLWGAWLGWTSHLAGDFIFGKSNRRAGRGPGIPLLPWWGYVGAGLRCGTWIEVTARWLLIAATAYLLLTLLLPLTRYAMR